MAARAGAGINDLPNEVLVAIFSELTITDLAWCGATCRRWHGLVSSFARLWKGKQYSTHKSPVACVETQAVLEALPPSLELLLEPGESFSFHILYPRAFLTVTHLGILDEFRRFRCSYLASRIDLAGDIVTYRSVVDVEALKKLRILRVRRTNPWATRCYREDYVVGAAALAFPNLTELFVGAESLSADHLDAVRGLARLRVLEVECPGLERLCFLRHCRPALEELVLVGCTGLPSCEFAELRHLQSLRTLRLRECRVEAADLATALAGMARLERLKACRSVSVRDLSVLRLAGRLRDVCIANTAAPDVLVQVAPDGVQLHLRQPGRPPGPQLRKARVVGVSLNADGVWTALPRLAEVGLSSRCLDYLAPLHSCPQLQHFCCEFVHLPDQPELLNVRLHYGVPIPK